MMDGKRDTQLFSSSASRKSETNMSLGEVLLTHLEVPYVPRLPISLWRQRLKVLRNSSHWGAADRTRPAPETLSLLASVSSTECSLFTLDSIKPTIQSIFVLMPFALSRRTHEIHSFLFSVSLDLFLPLANRHSSDRIFPQMVGRREQAQISKPSSPPSPSPADHTHKQGKSTD